MLTGIFTGGKKPGIAAEANNTRTKQVCRLWRSLLSNGSHVPDHLSDAIEVGRAHIKPTTFGMGRGHIGEKFRRHL